MMTKKIFGKQMFFICLALSLFYIPNSSAQTCWAPLAGGVGTNPSTDGISAMATYNGALYAAGIFDSASGIAAANIAKWNGSAWSSVGSVSLHPGAFDDCAMTVYNGELYLAGQFDSVNGIPVTNIAKWNGTTWSAVGTGIPTIPFSGNGYTVNVLAVYNGALYAGGSFTTAGGTPVNNIAKWDGSIWSDVGGGVDTASHASSAVNSLHVYNGKLYVGGNFAIAGTVPAENIAIWDGSGWSAMGTGIGMAHQGGVVAISDYQGEIYAGSDDFINNTCAVSKWDGSSWSVVSGSSFGLIFSMLPYDGHLILGGMFGSIGGVGVSNITEWNGSAWSALPGSGVSGGTQTAVSAMDTFGGGLYVGGSFDHAGNTAAMNVAHYTCLTGISEVSGAAAVQVYPNPTNGIINISTNNPAISEIRIYNLMGQEMHRSDIGSHAHIDMSGSVPGTYIYRISAVSGESLSSGCFVME